MKKLKQQQGVGVIKYFIATIILLLFIFNLLDQIQKSQDIFRRSYLTAPFFVISLSSFFIESKKYIFSTVLICAIYSATDRMGEMDFSLVLFVIAYSVYKKKEYGYLLGLIEVICITVRFQMFDMSIYQYFLQIIASLSVLMLVYVFIFKERKATPVSDFDKQKQILYMQGKTPEEIIKELNWSVQPRTVRTFILDQVKENNCNNEMQYVVKMLKSKEIDLNDI